MRYVSKIEPLTLYEVLEIICSTCLPDPDAGNPNLSKYIKNFNESRFPQGKKREEKLGYRYETKSRCNRKNGVLSVNTVWQVNEDRVWCLIEKLLQYDPPSVTEPKPGKPVEYPSEWIQNIEPFTEWEKRNKDWFNGNTKNIQDNSLYRAAGYYALGILDFTDSKSYITDFFKRFGIEEDTDSIIKCADFAGWKEDLVLLITYILLGGSRGMEWFSAKLTFLEKFVDEKMKPFKAAVAAEKRWLTDVRSFAPRSVQKTQSLSMQDFYVRPDFESQGNICDEPMKRLSDPDMGTRTLIVSRTGLGKSMYMRMTALCLARELEEKNERIEKLSYDAGLPRDKYVIYIPAYMFSYCYKTPEYKAWTEDFVKLYFNCMFRLSGKINFDKNSFRDNRLDDDFSGYDTDEQLMHFISLLAQKGKLVLIADSFDEIVSGSMREAYLNAVTNFRDSYCICPEAIGAHILLTSRDMSPATMESLASSLGISLSSSHVRRIQPMSVDKQEELILNWDKAFGGGIREIIKELDNHYFVELCENPYMLSVICSKPGVKINKVASDLISEILKLRTGMAIEMLENTFVKEILRSVKWEMILQNLAFETVQQAEPHFSVETLMKHCKPFFDADEDLSQEDLNSCYEILIYLFTTSVGLIVPADYEDDRFQFISNRIRYELAASKIYKDAQSVQKCISFLSGIEDDCEYIGLVVPLVCKSGNNVLLSDRIIQHMALRDFARENMGILNQALIDLVLERYGMNITCRIPSASNKSEYEHYVGADRLIMMRLLSSPVFAPTESEKAAIAKSHAFRMCEGFISENQKKLLQINQPDSTK